MEQVGRAGADAGRIPDVDIEAVMAKIRARVQRTHEAYAAPDVAPNASTPVPPAPMASVPQAEVVAPSAQADFNAAIVHALSVVAQQIAELQRSVAALEKRLSIDAVGGFATAAYVAGTAGHSATPNGHVNGTRMLVGG
jgi:hypothetical protein